MEVLMVVKKICQLMACGGVAVIIFGITEFYTYRSMYLQDNFNDDQCLNIIAIPAIINQSH